VNVDLAEILDRFAGLEVLVIGEAMLDTYFEGAVGRLCREAPVPIVDVAQRVDAPGGAANTAANVRRLGARATLLSAVGDDHEAATLRRVLVAAGLAAEGVVTQPGRQTLAKRRVLADGQLLVRFDQGSTDPVQSDVEAELLERLDELHARCDAIVVSDYGYGICMPRVVERLRALQWRQPRVLLVDAKDLARYREVGPTAVKPNYGEASALLGLPSAGGARRAELIVAHAARLLAATGAQVAAVTLDADGALVVERGRAAYRTYARPVANVRAAGAGDTFGATFALALAAGAHTPAAAELAAAATAVVVGQRGTTTCSADELQATLAGHERQKTIRAAAELVGLAELYRRQGRRIVFTNGCFDIIHRGHITYLNRAKALGDVLIVGVNSDDGVRRLKGPARPVNPLEDRLQVLAALSCVDHLVAFDEDTPTELIRQIRPDVFVKGGDYTRETLPEAPLVEQLGGVVQLLPYLMDRSTSGIIERIQAARPEPAGTAMGS
jgi:D-beta-D-heptose 7-phosphate kinase/D-beta-D-heptose 1-phosphate adenosyltransferase